MNKNIFDKEIQSLDNFYISFLSFIEFIKVILSAYSKYPLESHLDNLVTFTNFFNPLFSNSLKIYCTVASHSIFGLVAIMSSKAPSNSEIL